MVLGAHGMCRKIMMQIFDRTVRFVIRGETGARMTRPWLKRLDSFWIDHNHNQKNNDKKRTIIARTRTITRTRTKKQHQHKQQQRKHSSNNNNNNNNNNNKAGKWFLCKPLLTVAAANRVGGVHKVLHKAPLS